MGKVSIFNKLSFILDEKSINAVATETGIPYTTLYYYSKRTRNLPEKYENSLLAMYGREAYSRVRNLGYDVKTASTRRYWSPEKLNLTLGSDSEQIERYTFFNVSKNDPKHPKTLKEATQSEYWRYYHERITKSIQKRNKYLDEYGEEKWNSG